MKHKKHSLVLCDDLEGWMWGRYVGRRSKRDIYTYIYIHPSDSLLCTTESSTTL